MIKLYTTLFLSLLIFAFHAQNVNYTTEIVEFYQTGCDDGAGSDEEPTWKVYTRDNISTGWSGGTCHFVDGNIPIVYIPSATSIGSQTNTAATFIDVRFEAWEDDCDGGSGSDRCSFDNSCLLGVQEDDCLQYHDPLAGAFGAFPSIPFKDDPQCTWNEYAYNIGDFGVKIRIKWEYTMFTAGANIDICDGTIMLGGQGSGEWSVLSGTGGTFTDQFDPTTTFLGTAGQTYVLDWNTLPGCPTSNNDNITVNIFANPDPQLIADQDPICEGDDIIFSAQDGINYDFAMNTIGNTVQSSGSNSYTHTGIALTDSLTFVTVSNANGCSVIDTLTLNVQSAPTPSISRFGSNLTTGTYSFYQWYYNGSAIGGATSQNYTATANGSYTVLVVGANGCLGESAPEVITNVALEELASDYVQVYPNPAHDILTIKTELSNFKVDIQNLIGQSVITKVKPTEIDVSELPAGVYLLSIHAEGKKSTRKLIIE
ncbi:MAG: T9SS type A sorting domain-containing protein [Flavobacteriales bacterium]|nr:T9SS type A sorting domain-containing protein [Flavobacteriales bacterium]